MEIKLSCCCGASTRITGSSPETQDQAEKWRADHAGCSKLKYDYKTATETPDRLVQQIQLGGEPLTADVDA